MSSPPSAIHAFLLNEDLSLLLLREWIDYRGMGVLDIAITNRRMRLVWLQRLAGISNTDGDGWAHSHLSMRWLIMRGLKTSRIQMNVKNRAEISDLTFEGFKIANVRHVCLADCRNITDDCCLFQFLSKRDGISLDVGRHLVESIDLHCCESITDEGVSALALGCPQLHTINLGYCNRITDFGVSAQARG